MRIKRGYTLEQLAQEMLGDSRMTDEIMIPGWFPGLPLPENRLAYIRDESIGPPSRNWTKESPSVDTRKQQ